MANQGKTPAFKTAKNDMPEEEINQGISASASGDIEADPNFESFQEEQVGFAPYWEPEAGQWFYGAVTGIDMRDPDFVRYQCVNMHSQPIECFSGPKDNQKIVKVAKGEPFNISVYAQLRGRFDEYLDFLADGVLAPIRVRCEGKSKEKAKNGFPWWLYKIDASPETKKMLNTLRAKKLQEMRAAANPSTMHTPRVVAQIPRNAAQAD